MEEISLNPEIYQQILECFDESQSTSSDQYIIYTKLEYVLQNEPFFFCYIINILIESLEPESTNLLYSQLSLIFIRRYFKSIENEQADLFLDSILPVLVNIITENVQPIIPQTVLLLTNIVEFYGEEAMQDFDKILFSLISDKSTISTGIDAMLEVSIHCLEGTSKYQLKPEHLQELNQIFSENPDSELVYTFLAIILNLIRSPEQESYIDFASNEILEFINNNYSSFQKLSLFNAMCIAIFFFEKTGESELGDFIVFCIQNLDDLVNEGLECFLHESNEMEDNESEDANEIPFHSGLVEVLFECLQYEEEESNEFEELTEINCSDTAEEVLQKMADQHGEAVVDIILELISNCKNATQILKALCSIAYKIEDTNEFCQFAIENLKDERKGEAALFLSKIASPDNANQIISELIPLSLDQNKIIRRKVLISLENVLQSDFDIQIQMDWIPPLLDAFKILVDDDEDPCFLSHEIYLILCQTENLNDELFQSFYNYIYELFFAEDIYYMFMMCACNLLEILLKKLNIEYSPEIEAIIGRIVIYLQTVPKQTENDHIICEDATMLFCKDNFCSLMTTLIELYTEQITSLVGEPLLIISEKIVQSDFILQDSDAYWKLVIQFFSEIPDFIPDSDVFKTCFETAMHAFNPFHFILDNVDLVSVFLILALKSLNEETVDRLLYTSFEIIQKNENNLSELKNVVGLIKEILKMKEENNSLLPEQVQFFEEIESRMIEENESKTNDEAEEKADKM